MMAGLLLIAGLLLLCTVGYYTAQEHTRDVEEYWRDPLKGSIL